jgi:CheY-like chemotaxis protein
MNYENPCDKPVVLCVDDDKVLLDITKTALEFAGYEVLTATDGHAALEVFTSQTVDAVVLDFEMPGMDGGEVAREMKRRNPRIPKLMFSGCTSIPSDASAAIEAFCSKPADLRMLLSRVKSLITKFRTAGSSRDLSHAHFAKRLQHSCSL